MLSELGGFIRERKIVSMRDLSSRFATNPDVLRGMLDIWVRKGKVACHRVESKCSKGCCACGTSDMEMYEWTEGKPPSVLPSSLPANLSSGCCH